MSLIKQDSQMAPLQYRLSPPDVKMGWDLINKRKLAVCTGGPASRSGLCLTAFPLGRAQQAVERRECVPRAPGRLCLVTFTPLLAFTERPANMVMWLARRAGRGALLRAGCWLPGASNPELRQSHWVARLS